MHAEAQTRFTTCLSDYLGGLRAVNATLLIAYGLSIMSRVLQKKHGLLLGEHVGFGISFFVTFSAILRQSIMSRVLQKPWAFSVLLGEYLEFIISFFVTFSAILLQSIMSRILQKTWAFTKGVSGI